MRKNVYTLLTHKSLRLASFKVCLYVIVLSVTVCTVRYVCLLRRVQIFVLVSYPADGLQCGQM